MAWNFKDLRTSVKSTFGLEQVSLLDPCLQSLEQRLYFQRYHFQEAEGLMSGLAGDELSQLQRVRLMFGTDEEEHKFHFTRLKAAAHINACIASMHSSADILGHAIYYARGMNFDSDRRLPIADVSIHSVSKKLPAGDLAKSVRDFVSHRDFIYVQDLVNHSKHRSMVPMPYSVDFSGDEEHSHGLKFGEFDMKGRHHEARWVTPTLTAEYDRQQSLISKIGSALNAEARLLELSNESSQETES